MADTNVSTPADEPSREAWRSRLREEIESSEKRFRKNKNRWNAWYYGFLAGGVGLPALSALVLKLETLKEPALKNDLAAVLAALGAVFTSVMAAFNFRRRWAVSRTARTEVQQLKVDVLGPDVELAKVAARLKESLAKYNDGVLDD
jgi:hypothetical protein